MYCKYCGNKIEEFYKFCKYCGSNVDSFTSEETGIFCNKCGFKNDESLKHCCNCGNQLIIPEQLVIPGAAEQIPKNTLDSKRDPFIQNYKKIFNIFFYTVIGFIIFFILISFFRYGASPASVLGTIMDIFFNFWIWLFLIFIFLFRKNHKVWALILSIIFGAFTILAASSPYILPLLNS
jgi:uncharacterized membrane protein YvbJ